MSAQPSDKVLIVGAGCFGLSTAYHLLKNGFIDVTVIDRSDVLPSPDGSSVDFNRIVRTSYEDPFYSKLAHDAVQVWKNREEWGDIYHESGVVVIGAGYADKAYENDVALGCRIERLDDISSAFPPGLAGKLASSHGCSYLNRDGGWAHAEQGVKAMMDKVLALGGKVLPKKTVKTLKRTGGRTTGVQCADGSSFEDLALVILAAGAWTVSSFPELGLDTTCLATGQCVAMIQLTPEEAETYKDVPVVLNFANGFYCFPPSADNIIKMAIHDTGYTHLQNGVSSPRTIVTDPERGLAIPKPMLEELRTILGKIYPGLAKKPCVRTRLCWYTDSLDGDWVIGPHPTDKGVFLATGGSGHAYKFLPVIGSLVARSVQGTLEPDLAGKFAVDRQVANTDRSREGRQPLQELDLDQLCTVEDLTKII